MHRHLAEPFRPARLLTAAAPLAAAAMIAACGSSSPTVPSAPTRSSSSTGSGSTAGSTLAFSNCVRANGVPNFGDINAGSIRLLSTQGPNGQTLSVNGVPVDAPAFQAARQKCQKYMPHAHASKAQTAQALQRGLKFARCMRSHGVPNFPDPKVITGPGGGQQAYLPGVNPQSPAFQAAATACGGGPKGP
jgi:hypothetical protein